MIGFYRALLYLYPAYFRNEYRAELIRAHEERVRGRSAVAAFFIALADVVPGALAVRFDHLRQNTAAAMTQPTLGVDLTLAFRQMRRTPLFSVVVIAVLGLGIGINAGMLTLLDVYAWQPAFGIMKDAPLARLMPQGAPNADRSLRTTTLSYADLLALREKRDVFAGVLGFADTDLAVDFGGGPEVIEAEYVTGNYFSLLGVRLEKGSGVFRDDDPAIAQSVVIGESVWRSYFGASDTALGATIHILGLPFRVAGITRPLFTGVNIINTGEHRIWLPVAARAVLEPDERGEAARRTEPWLSAVGLLASGVAPGDVERRTGALASQLARQRSTGEGGRLLVGAERLTGMRSTDSDTKELVFAFLLVAALVVLITCTNVGALLLGRAVARRREIGIRLSLGATRLRLVRQLLTESLVYAVAGAVLGIALFGVFSRVIYATVAETIPGLEPGPVTFLYAAALAAIATLVMGLAPALTATRAEIGEVIKGGGQHEVKRSRLQAVFVVAQLASSQPVLVISALILASMSHFIGKGAVRAPDTIVSMQAVVLRPGQGDSLAERAGLLRVEERLLREPGVRAVGLTVNSGTIEGIRQMYVTPGYFAARDMALARGRGITAAEYRQPFAVINELTALKLWRNQNPIGKRIERRLSSDGPVLSFEVIGVVRQAAFDLEEPQPVLYAPLGYAPDQWGARLVVKTAGEARAAVPRLREAIREAEPYAAVDAIHTVAESAASRVRDAQLSNLAAFAISTAALLLASLGLYAIIAYAVAQRTREIGVRMAIGAEPARVVREFFRSGMKVSIVGLAIGLPVTIIGIRLIVANLMNFTFQNVVAVALMVPVLLGVAALASWLPARRAGRVDPRVALQSE